MSAKTLTQPAVDRVQPHPGQRLSIPDGKVPGLILMVNENSKSWSLRYRFAGKQERVRLGSANIGRISLVEARDAALEILRKVDRGIDPKPGRTCDPKTATRPGMKICSWCGKRLPSKPNSSERRFCMPGCRSRWSAAAQKIGETVLIGALNSVQAFSDEQVRDVQAVLPPVLIGRFHGGRP